MHLSTLDHFASLSGNALKDVVALALHPDNADAPRHRRYLMAVLDPMITYGISGKLTGGTGYREFDYDSYNLLDRLAARELTGNAAKQALIYYTESYTPAAVTLLNRALNKDLRCGVGISLINSLGLDFRIPVFEVQLAQPGEAKRMKAGQQWVGCIKYDGMRALIEVNDNRVNFWTRSGKPIPALDPIAPDVLAVFGGQRLMLDSEGVGTDFLDTISQLRKKTGADLKATTIAQVFDVVDLDDFRNADNKTYFGGPLIERLDRLSDYFGNCDADTPNVQRVEHWDVRDWDHAVELSDEWMSLGLEGGIFKLATDGYIKKRTHGWLKRKLEDPVTARIVAVYEGEKGKQFEGMLGGVTIEIDGVRSDIGGGWSHEERAAIWAAETGVDVRVVDDDEQAGRYVRPDPARKVVDRLIDVLSNGKNPSGALRHGRKKSFRDVEGAIA